MRQTALKRTSNGIVRNLGKLANGSQPKFYLGFDKAIAEQRFNAIVKLWESCKSAPNLREPWRDELKPPRHIWNEEALAAARVIAKGEKATIAEKHFEQSANYFERVAELRQLVEVVPADLVKFDEGQAALVASILAAQNRLDKATAITGTTGQHLQDALNSYAEWLKETNSMNDWLAKQVSQLKTIKAHLPNPDLGEICDKLTCDGLFAVFRNRPTSDRYKRPMSKKSCKGYLWLLNKFFSWLHDKTSWRWRKPEGFDSISKRPNRLEIDSEKLSEKRRKTIWKRTELQILYRYATPLERLLILLGLNCSYGADQIGRLNVGDVYFSAKPSRPSTIERIRHKKETWAIHSLFAETEKALQWALARRQKISTDSKRLIVNGNGRPYWYLTKGGNRCQQIPNAWRKLWNRVRKDYPDFRWLPFNFLRDTSSQLIRNMGGEEFASIHLAHSHHSSDKSLPSYNSPNYRRHTKLIVKLEKKLSVIWEGIEFAEKNRSLIGLAKIEEIRRLRNERLTQQQIANKLNLSRATVAKYCPKPVVA